MSETLVAKTVYPEMKDVKTQYSLAKILSIWALAAMPMAVLGWIVAPMMAPDLQTDPLGAISIRIGLLTFGLIWQFALSMILVFQEEGNLRWQTIRRRLWLNKPQDPKTGNPRAVLFLWAIPFLLLTALLDAGLASTIDGLWVSIFPFFAEPAGFSLSAALASSEAQAQFVGAWWILGLFVVFALFNSVFGEEFLFRGVLLPQMNGVFGRWDWVANGVLFGLYHWHQPWGILTGMIGGVFFLAFPSKRFQSSWMAIIVHSGQSIFFLFLMLGLILGLA